MTIKLHPYTVRINSIHQIVDFDEIDDWLIDNNIDIQVSSSTSQRLYTVNDRMWIDTGTMSTYHFENNEDATMFKMLFGGKYIDESEKYMVNYKKGDITDATEDVVAHGVNCKGSFGSGVAGAIKEKHPYVRDKYLNLDGHLLGTCQFVNYNDQVWVNAHTQENYGYDNQQYASLEAVADCFESIADMMKARELKTLAMPKIGCGLGGLKWADVEMLAEELFKDVDVFVYEL